MTLAQLVRGDSVFLDANVLVFHFEPHFAFGPPCTDLLRRIELTELSGFTSTHVLSEVAHRLMTMEASALFNWSSKIVSHLKQSPGQMHRLGKFRSAIQMIPQMRIQVLTIPAGTLIRLMVRDPGIGIAHATFRGQSILIQYEDVERNSLVIEPSESK